MSPSPIANAAASSAAEHVEPEGAEAQTTPRQFRNSILQAAGWSMVGYFGAQVLRILTSLVLTRLLVPEMFGIMAIATMVQVAVGMFSDLGIRPAAIQSHLGGRQGYLDTAWTLQFLQGVWIWLACVAIAFGIAVVAGQGLFPAGSVYNEPVLPAVIAVTCFSAVIGGLQSTKIISAYRELTLGRVTVIEIVAQCVSLGVAVVLALETKSVWSFVAATLCSSAVVTSLSFCLLPGPGNRFRLDRAAVQDLVRFGKWVLLSSGFTVLAANGDRILLAGWIGPAVLGLYILAYNLVAMLEGAGSRLFHSVAMPALSKVGREEPMRLGAVFNRLRLPFDVVFVAAAGATYAAGDVVVLVLYDPRYEAAGGMLRILSFGLLFSRYGVLCNVYLAMGKPRAQTLLNLVRSISVFTLLPLGHFLFGIEGALWAIALHGFPSLILLGFINARHGLNDFRLELLVLLAWPLGYTLGYLAEFVIFKVFSLA